MDISVKKKKKTLRLKEYLKTYNYVLFQHSVFKKPSVIKVEAKMPVSIAYHVLMLAPLLSQMTFFHCVYGSHRADKVLKSSTDRMTINED